MVNAIDFEFSFTPSFSFFAGSRFLLLGASPFFSRSVFVNSNDACWRSKQAFYGGGSNFFPRTTCGGTFVWIPC